MEAREVIELINKEIERICLSLPERGRRLVILEYVLTQEMLDALLTNAEFKKQMEKGNPNIGGIPITIGEKFEIKYYQAPKQRKHFRMEKIRGKNIVNKLTETKEEMDTKSF